MCQYYIEDGVVKMKNYFTTMGIAAQCIADRKPILLPDSREHARFHSGLDGTELPIFVYGNTEDDTTINVAYLPIFDSDDREPMAVLSVRDKRKRMSFNRSDLLALASLSKQVCSSKIWMFIHAQSNENQICCPFTDSRQDCA